jgi:hypothetical protein
MNGRLRQPGPIARLHVKLILGQICGFNAEEAVSTIRIQPKVLFENG